MTTQNENKINLGVGGGGGGNHNMGKLGKWGGGGRVFAISLFLCIQRFLSCSLYYY